MAANMDTVGTFEMAKSLAEEKLFTAMQITGKKVCTCGINPINVAVLV